MMQCKNCNGTKIRSRQNYSHGRKSKGTASFVCKDCGSTSVKPKYDSGNFRKRR